MDDVHDNPKNPWDSEIYPKPIYDLLLNLKEQYSNIPIIITENGVGYHDKLEDGKVHDQNRIEFQEGYLEWILKVKKDGCDIRGYFIWSTMDLYSPVYGFEKRYGLVYIDYNDNCRRIPKDSYSWYKDFIASVGE